MVAMRISASLTACLIALCGSVRMELEIDDSCFETGRCARMMVEPEKVGRSGSTGINLNVQTCAIQRSGRLVPKRYAYSRPGLRSVKIRQRDGVWVSDFRRQSYKLEQVFLVRRPSEALHGVQRLVDDARRQPVDIDMLPELNWTTAASSGGQQKLSSMGQLSPDELLQRIARARSSPDLQVVTDLRLIEGSEARCPKLMRDGNHAYNDADHFKLMKLASGSACHAPSDESSVETYCLMPREGSGFPGDFRGWILPVDLRQAKPLVRNPSLEPGGGRDIPESARKVSVKYLQARGISRWMEPFRKTCGKTLSGRDLTMGQFVDACKDDPTWTGKCRYVSYSPASYVDKFELNVKVMLNANFFLFLEVQGVPCGTPLGPVVADGMQVQTQHDSLELIKRHKKSRKERLFEIVKIDTVLVMYEGVGAFVMEPANFDLWFSTIQSTTERKKINAVTGHRILDGGEPIAGRASFGDVGQPRFWDSDNARTVVGLQYDGRCPAGKVPLGTQCGNMLVIAQFEKSSKGARVTTFHGDEAMQPRDRPASSGVSIPAAQEMLEFMMLDVAINLDGSGSSAMWTSIGDLSEKRTQPSNSSWHHDDVDKPTGYHFRPSPILFGFEPARKRK